MTRYFGVHTLEGEWHSLLPRYILLADRVAGKKVLDIGCGTGIGSSLLLELGAESVNAIDHRPEVLELARLKHAKQGLNFHVMFWEELDFPDSTFDIALCLDPTSPVTDPSLLQEVTRVLNSGGEYICAIERHTVDGIESLLPRYGYSSTGEEVDLTPSEERVPQIGLLDDYFETIVSVVQRPRYSFVFDFSNDDEHTMRRRSGSNDESGLWVGEDPNSEAGSAEQTDKRAGRWLNIDRRLADRDGDPAAVELLYCGGEHMPPPSPREVEMPYRGLVDRLHQLFSELQLRNHPAQSTDDANPFAEREQTSEFRGPSKRSDTHPRPLSDHQGHHRYTTSDSASTTVRYPPRDEGWRLLQQQLDHMTNLYHEVRADMQNLFVQTRKELAERDRYIEQLVDTFHRWRKDDLQRQHASPRSQHASPRSQERADRPQDREEALPTQKFTPEDTGDFDRAPTTIFEKPDSDHGLFEDLRDTPDEQTSSEAEEFEFNVGAKAADEKKATDERSEAEQESSNNNVDNDVDSDISSEDRSETESAAEADSEPVTAAEAEGEDSPAADAPASSAAKRSSEDD